MSIHFSTRTICAAAASLVLSLAARAGENLAQYRTADALWQHVEVLKAGPEKQPTSADEVLQFLKKSIDAANAFIERYPKDPRSWNAKILVLQFQGIAVRFGGPMPDGATVKATLNEIATAPDAPKELKAQARLNLLAPQFSEGKLTPELEAAIAAFRTDFPDSPALAEVEMARVSLLKGVDPARAESTLRELAKSPNPKLAATAKRAVAALDVMKTPIDLQFTAVDGRKVDLSKMRGKVVLIDFWATWCGPCMQELPSVLATYKKLNAQGFEIVGISLDEEKAALLATVKQRGIKWPQFFDGKKFENKISAGYGISQIPTMWLVNKKGMVVDQDARENLQSKVEKLLAE